MNTGNKNNDPEKIIEAMNTLERDKKKEKEREEKHRYTNTGDKNNDSFRKYSEQ